MSGHLKSKLSNTKIVSVYYILIFILTIYATYKNGIILYQRNLISILDIFKPLFLVIISLVIPIIINYIYNNNIKKVNYNILEDYAPVFMALVTLTLPLNISYILFIFIMLIVNILKLFYKFDFVNYYNLTKILFILILLIIGRYSYLTLYDINIDTNFSTLDLFLGRGIGGLATTNLLLLIICYFIMLSNESFKKEIPIVSIISYIITLVVVDLLINNNIVLDIKYLITNGFIFGSLFIATIPMYSPVDHKNITIYSILIGILSFAINKVFNIYDSIYFAIFAANIIIVVYELLEGKINNEHK